MRAEVPIKLQEDVEIQIVEYFLVWNLLEGDSGKHLYKEQSAVEGDTFSLQSCWAIPGLQVTLAAAGIHLLTLWDTDSISGTSETKFSPFPVGETLVHRQLPKHQPLSFMLSWARAWL